MYDLLSWVVDRVVCAFTGHRFTAGWVYYPPSESVLPGYRCGRCGKEQLMLWRWQSVHDSERDNDD